jgi:hypothetical protein
MRDGILPAGVRSRYSSKTSVFYFFLFFPFAETNLGEARREFCVTGMYKTIAPNAALSSITTRLQI